MKFRQSHSIVRGAAAPYGATTRMTRTLERQIEDIMKQVAPRRQTEGVERGVVTTVFVTIDGFTALCEEHEPPEIASILEIYLETIADSVRKFLGTVHNTMHDTVMATWNAVSPQADHALLAVNSAIDMAERIDDVNGRLRTRGLPDITYAMGIDTGDALVRRLAAVRRDDEVIGNHVNIARLLSLTGSDCSILIGEGTRVSVGNDILVDPMEPAVLPGKRNLVRIFRIVGRMTPL